MNNSVTISGLGAANLAVNGNAASRVFYISSSKTVTISGLTITNGFAQSGGGIYNDHSSLTVSNCTITSNFAGNDMFSSDGGGIYNDGSPSGNATLTVVNSTLSGNSASHRRRRHPQLRGADGS